MALNQQITLKSEECRDKVKVRDTVLGQLKTVLDFKQAEFDQLRALAQEQLDSESSQVPAEQPAESHVDDSIS